MGIRQRHRSRAGRDVEQGELDDSPPGAVGLRRAAGNAIGLQMLTASRSSMVGSVWARTGHRRGFGAFGMKAMFDVNVVTVAGLSDPLRGVESDREAKADHRCLV